MFAFTANDALYFSYSNKSAFPVANLAAATSAFKSTVTYLVASSTAFLASVSAYVVAATAALATAAAVILAALTRSSLCFDLAATSSTT